MTPSTGAMTVVPGCPPTSTAVLGEPFLPVRYSFSTWPCQTSETVADGAETTVVPVGIAAADATADAAADAAAAALAGAPAFQAAPLTTGTRMSIGSPSSYEA